MRIRDPLQVKPRQSGQTAIDHWREDTTDPPVHLGPGLESRATLSRIAVDERRQRVDRRSSRLCIARRGPPLPALRYWIRSFPDGLAHALRGLPCLGHPQRWEGTQREPPHTAFRITHREDPGPAAARGDPKTKTALRSIRDLDARPGIGRPLRGRCNRCIGEPDRRHHPSQGFSGASRGLQQQEPTSDAVRQVIRPVSR